MAELKPRLSRPRRNQNELQQVFSTRMEGDVKRKIEDWIANNGLTKRQATEFAFELAMECHPKLQAR